MIDKKSKMGVDYIYSSTQFNFPDDIAEEILEYSNENIKDEDLYTGDGKGREDEIHVTLLYGLKEQNPEKIYDKLDKDILKPIKVVLGKVTRFEQDEYDVMKIDVKSWRLEDLNNYIKDNFEYENDYPEYHPHVTLAYVKKGKCEDIIEDDTFEGTRVVLDNLKISAPEKDKSKIIKLSGRPKHILVLKSATDIKYARELLNSLLYHNINYVISGNTLTFRSESDMFEAQRMLKGYGIFSMKRIAGNVSDRGNYELLKEPDHQALQSSEPEKTDITDEDELTTYRKMAKKYEDYIRRNG